MDDDKLIVKINIRKHEVLIKDELIVHIYHNKNCMKPCPDTELIVNYLQAEMFVAEGFMVAGE